MKLLLVENDWDISQLLAEIFNEYKYFLYIPTHGENKVFREIPDRNLVQDDWDINQLLAGIFNECKVVVYLTTNPENRVVREVLDENFIS